MRRPKDVEEIVVNLTINSISLTSAGIFFLALGLVDQSPLGGPLIWVYLLLILLGMSIGVVAMGFYTLQPWAYRAASILISGLKGDRSYFKRKLNSPELRRAFGLSSSDSAQDQTGGRGPS